VVVSRSAAFSSDSAAELGTLTGKKEKRTKTGKRKKISGCAFFSSDSAAEPGTMTGKKKTKSQCPTILAVYRVMWPSENPLGTLNWGGGGNKRR
jgi:hypothetical protein